jgi:predicted regulator of Ras-like GTPase activity (Roadblock/LC7/MglB family)
MRAHGGLLDAFVALPEVRGALLVDLSGRVVDQFAFRDRSVRIQAASLAAGLHASGARLSEAAGHPGPSLLRIRAGAAGHLLLLRVPPPATHILLLHVGVERAPWEEELPELLRGLAPRVPGGPLITEASDFEASLEGTPPAASPPEGPGGEGSRAGDGGEEGRP